jgi:hypothetical protein
VIGSSNSSGGGSIAQDGLAVYGGTYVTISYYSIHHTGRCPFFLSTQNFVAEYGYTGTFVSTSAAHAELASIWGFTIGSNGVVFRYNIFTHSDGTGGLIFDNEENPTGAGMQVYGNVFYKPAGDTWAINNGLIGGWTGGGGEQFHNVSVFNNTFINTTSADGYSPIGNFANTYSGNTATNNLFYNTNPVDYSKWTNNTNSLASSNPVVNAAALNFQLLADTAKGTTLAAPYNTDPLGTVRGNNGIWDSGAYQMGGTSTTPPPAPTGLAASVQ